MFPVGQDAGHSHATAHGMPSVFWKPGFIGAKQLLLSRMACPENGVQQAMVK